MRDLEKTKLVVAVAAVIALGAGGAFLWSCGGGSGSGSGSGFSCSLTVAGQSYCYAYSNLTSATGSSAKSMCSSQGGTIVSACPTDGLVGCCEISQSGLTYQSCDYFGTEETDQMGCAGTWTSGSAGLNNGGSTSTKTTTTTSSNTSTSTSCTTSSGGGVCCPEGYCTLGSAHGYFFSYSDANDGGSSTATLPRSDTMCVTGTAAGTVCSAQSCYSSHWGAGIGVNLNQPKGQNTTPANFASAGSSGVTYALDAFGGQMRLVVGDSKTDYCYNLTSPSGTIPWSSFNSACWGSGTPLSGPPASFTSVRFQVVADTSYGDDTSFDFCVTKLSL